MRNISTSFLFIFTIILASCSDDALILQEPEVTFPDTVELLEGNLIGSVEDEAGLPISDALVTCLSCLPVQEIMTDDKGDFRFLNVEVKGGSAYLTVNSSGKFDGFRRVPLLEDKLNYTRVLLKEKVSLGRLSASQGGDLSHISGAVISLPASGIVDAAGQSYTGEYNVFMSWIDPTSEDLNLRMVGDLSAIDSEGELVGLSTYGMLQVELEATDGSELNLNEGSTAVLEFPVPQSIRANAPTEIPLWNYNEANGYWVEEGSAVLDGDKYVGEVSHFSTWNVDVKIDPVDICGSIVTSEFKKGLSYYQVKLGGETFQGTGGWLCDDGSFRFINVPSGQILTLDILNYCGELIEAINLGPYESGKVELDPITISEDTEITFVKLTGNSIDCDNEALTEGMVIISLEYDSYVFPIDSDGSYDVSFPTCGEFDGTVQVFNTIDFTASISIAISDQTDDFNFIDFQACDVLAEEYFYYKFGRPAYLGGTVERFEIDPGIISYSENLGQYTVLFEDTSSLDKVRFKFENAPVEGIDQISSSVEVADSTLHYFVTELTIQFNTVGPELSPGVYEYIEGSFKNSESTGLRINGTFRVKPE